MINLELSYRPVKMDDLGTICSFPQSAEELFFMFSKAEYPLTASQLQEAIESRFDSTVVLLDNKIVGFANFYEVKEGKHCSVDNVIVDGSLRNKGIGKFLIESMEQITIKKYNAIEIHISCFNTNTNGLLLYTKLGYIPYEIEKWTTSENQSLPLIKLKKVISIA